MRRVRRFSFRVTEAEYKDVVERVFSPAGEHDDLTIAQAFEQAGDRFDVDNSRAGRQRWMTERMKESEAG